MKFHSGEFERSLRRKVRRTIRASKELKREFKRANKLRKHYSSLLIGRPLASAFVALLVWLTFGETGHIGAALAVVTYWSLVIMVYRAHGFLLCLFQDNELSAFFWLPLDESEMFSRQLRKFLLKSLFSLGDILACLIVLGAGSGFSVKQWLAVVPVALLAWATLLATAVLCAVKLPRFVTAAVGLLSVGWIAMLILGSSVPWELVVSLLEDHSQWINALSPTGWSLMLFQSLSQPGHWANCWLVIPMGLLFWTTSKFLTRLRRDYRFTEAIQEEAADQLPGNSPESLIGDDESPQKHFGVTAIEEVIQTRLFLAPPVWQNLGWLESMLWSWLKPRERVLIEIAFPEGINLTARWKKTSRNLVILLVAGFGVAALDPRMKPWVIGISVVATIALVLSQMLNTGRAFQPVFCSGVTIPFYSVYPAGYRELAGVFFKYACAQLPVISIWSAVCGAMVTHLLGMGFADGAVHGARACVFIFAARLVLIVFSFSSGTNDSSGKGFRTVFLFLSIVCFGGLYLIAGMIGVLVPGHLPGLAITLLAALIAYGMFRVYGWFYNRNRFDLMKLPTTDF